MERQIVSLWENNKHSLRSFISEQSVLWMDSDNTTDPYHFLFGAIVHRVFNESAPFYCEKRTGATGGMEFNFSIDLKPAQTKIWYGSCEVNDAMEAIYLINTTGKPTEEQVNDVMTLALHLIQRAKFINHEH